MSLMLLTTNKIPEISKCLSKAYGFWDCSKYMQITSEGRLDFDDCIKLLNDLYKINLDCWNERYKDQIEYKYTIKKYNFTPDISNYQCLKWLQCLKYNIEAEYIKDKQSINFQFKIDTLKCIINCLKDFIIRTNKEYDSASWSH